MQDAVGNAWEHSDGENIWEEVLGRIFENRLLVRLFENRFFGAYLKTGFGENIWEQVAGENIWEQVFWSIFKNRFWGEYLRTGYWWEYLRTGFLEHILEQVLRRRFENRLLVRIFENMMQRRGPCASVDSPVLFSSFVRLLVTNFSYCEQSYLLLRQTQNLDVASQAVVFRRTTILPGSISSVRRCVYGLQMQSSQKQWTLLPLSGASSPWDCQ